MKIFEYINEIGLIIGGIAAFFTGRRMKKSEVQSSELENIKTVREIEKQLLQDVKDQVQELIKTKEELERIIKEQRERIKLFEATCIRNCGEKTI